MGLFDGLASALNRVFGAEVTFTDRLGVSHVVQGVFREVEVEDPIADGRGMPTLAPVVRVPRDVMPSVVRGWTVAPSIAAPRVFTVLHVERASGPAADRFVTIVLEELP